MVDQERRYTEKEVRSIIFTRQLVFNYRQSLLLDEGWEVSQEIMVARQDLRLKLLKSMRSYPDFFRDDIQLLEKEETAFIPR